MTEADQAGVFWLRVHVPMKSKKKVTGSVGHGRVVEKRCSAPPVDLDAQLGRRDAHQVMTLRSGDLLISNGAGTGK
jgi:hypothetical protein